MIHESSCETEINVNEGIHARLINSVSSVQRGMNKLPGLETKLINNKWWWRIFERCESKKNYHFYELEDLDIHKNCTFLN